MALGARGLDTCLFQGHKACKRSLILKLWSWRSHGKVMDKILKFSGYTLYVDFPYMESILKL